MKARIKWVEDRTFIGESGSGHKIVLGTAFGPEGRSPGPSPMELVLIGMGGCSGYDVVHILEKGREAIEDVAVEPESARNRNRRCLPAFTCISWSRDEGLHRRRLSAPSRCQSRNTARHRQ